MGKVTDGVLGGISGKVGNLVFYQVDGETLVRTKPGGRSGTSALQSYNQQAFTGVFVPYEERVGDWVRSI